MASPARPSEEECGLAVAGLHAAMEELRVAEEELLAARADADAERTRYRDLFEFAPDGYLVTDGNGKIVEANRAAAATLNVPPSYVVAKPLLVYVLKEDRPVYYEALSSMRRMDRGEWTLRVGPRGREPVWVHATVGAIRAWDGTLEGLRWVARDVTEQRRADDELTRHRAQLRAMASELSAAEEKERRRIATGIHDRVSQTLAIAKMSLSAVRDAVPGGQTQAVRDVLGMLDTAIEESRSLTFELSPPILYELGLVPALQWLGELTHRRHGLAVRVSDRLGGDTPLQLRLLLFQAIRELLGNIVKHAGATLATVTLKKVAGGMVRVDVQDNGVGFATSTAGTGQNGYGLFNLRTRFDEIGGHFSVKSEPGTARW